MKLCDLLGSSEVSDDGVESVRTDVRQSGGKNIKRMMSRKGNPKRPGILPNEPGSGGDSDSRNGAETDVAN